MTARRQALGAAGEALTADWYTDHGYQVVARNWRCRDGELDLIVARDDTVAFCEVKTRSSDAFGIPAEAVTRAKQLRIRRLAATWLSQVADHPTRVRFDVASVRGRQVEVIEAAF